MPIAYGSGILVTGTLRTRVATCIPTFIAGNPTIVVRSCRVWVTASDAATEHSITLVCTNSFNGITVLPNSPSAVWNGTRPLSMVLDTNVGAASSYTVLAESFGKRANNSTSTADVVSPSLAGAETTSYATGIPIGFALFLYAGFTGTGTVHFKWITEYDVVA